MSSLIEVNQLTKVYRIYWGPRALLKELLFGKAFHHPVEALKNVTFQVSGGETFGIIGDNGAGKSTLLKILAGTAFPTSGTARVAGQVAALLELGAAFHPEFSGRANIYFSGALMSRTQAEIRRLEEEIIAFSELEEFIDQPVRTFSSGMMMRLGFAVATAFDPAVLIIDEALAVGDQHFTAKCLDRMKQFRAAGKTILLVSHDLNQIRNLCDRVLWLQNGYVEALGYPREVVDRYTQSLQADTGGVSPDQERRICWIEAVELHDQDGQSCDTFRTGDTLRLQLRAHFGREFRGEPGIGVGLIRDDGVILYTSSNTIERVPLRRLGPESYAGTLTLPDLPLLGGRYAFNVATTDERSLQAYDIVERAVTFTVEPEDQDQGIIRLPFRVVAQPAEGRPRSSAHD